MLFQHSSLHVSAVHPVILLGAQDGYEHRSLSINNDDQLRRIGTSTELTFCPAKKRSNGDVCGAAVSKRKGMAPKVRDVRSLSFR